MVSMAIASMWASMTAWFTPTVLFCATNIIIATIFIASNNTNRSHHHQQHVQPNHLHSPTPNISRVSSFLDRARSFKLPSFSTTATSAEPHDQYQYITNPSESKTATYSSSSRLAQSIHSSYPSEPETQLARTPSFIDRVKSFRFGATYTQPETSVGSDPSHDPEHNHAVRSKSERKSVKMKKSRSEMRINDEDEDDEDVDLRRPETARERRSHDVDEEVDARADHFISRFKQQLKLQRIESLVRYNQMLKRSV